MLMRLLRTGAYRFMLLLAASRMAIRGCGECPGEVHEFETSGQFNVSETRAVCLPHHRAVQLGQNIINLLFTPTQGPASLPR